MQHAVQITSQITVWPLFSHPNPHQSCILCCPKLLPQQKIFLSLSKFCEWQKPTRSWAAGIIHHNPQEVWVTLKNSPSAIADSSREGDISDPIKTEQRCNKLTVISFCTYLHECGQGSGKRKSKALSGPLTMKAVNLQMGACIDLCQCLSRRRMQALNWRSVIDKKTENVLQFLQILLPPVGIDAFDFLSCMLRYKIIKYFKQKQEKDGTSTSDKGD